MTAKTTAKTDSQDCEAPRRSLVQARAGGVSGSPSGRRLAPPTHRQFRLAGSRPWSWLSVMAVPPHGKANSQDSQDWLCLLAADAAEATRAGVEEVVEGRIMLPADQALAVAIRDLNDGSRQRLTAETGAETGAKTGGCAGGGGGRGRRGIGDSHVASRRVGIGSGPGLYLCTPDPVTCAKRRLSAHTGTSIRSSRHASSDLRVRTSSRSRSRRASRVRVAGAVRQGLVGPGIPSAASGAWTRLSAHTGTSIRSSRHASSDLRVRTSSRSRSRRASRVRVAGAVRQGLVGPGIPSAASGAWTRRFRYSGIASQPSWGLDR